MSYMPVNLLGGTKMFFGRPVYYESSLTDWSTPWITFGLYCAIAFIQWLSIQIVARITLKTHGFVEHNGKWRKDLIVERYDLQEKRKKQKTETDQLQDKLRKIEDLDLNFSEKRKLCEKLIKKTLESQAKEREE